VVFSFLKPKSAQNWHLLLHAVLTLAKCDRDPTPPRTSFLCDWRLAYGFVAKSQPYLFVHSSIYYTWLFVLALMPDRPSSGACSAEAGLRRLYEIPPWMSLQQEASSCILSEPTTPRAQRSCRCPPRRRRSTVRSQTCSVAGCLSSSTRGAACRRLRRPGSSPGTPLPQRRSVRT
jgi:hypothetical protein